MGARDETRVLIVDDQETNRSLLREHVAMGGYTPVMASDGLEALDELHAAAPDLVILDLLLPRLDGVAVLKRVRSNPDLAKIPVVVISGAAEESRIRECIQLGADDFIPKPFRAQTLQSRLSHCLSRRKHVSATSSTFRPRDFAHQILSSIELLEIATSSEGEAWAAGLFEMVERYAPETRAHLARTSAFCRVLASELSKNRRFAPVLDHIYIDNFAQTAALHDIGKLAIPDQILSKPGALDSEELRIMRRHVTVGAEVLRELYRRFPSESRFELAIELTLYHHERWDGFGYPYGLSGESIPLAGRLMAVADVYDALRSERSYKKAFSHDLSREIILAGSGKQFDPAVVAAFLACELELASIHEGCLPEVQRAHDEEARRGAPAKQLPKMAAAAFAASPALTA